MLGLKAIQATFPIFIIVILGILFRTTKLVSPTTIRDVKKLIVRVTLPLLLFQAFCEMLFQVQFLLIIALIFGACTILFWLSRKIIQKFRIEQVYIPYLMAGFEAGMLGYAIFGSIYGPENIPAFALIDLGQVLFVFFILVPSLEEQQGKQSDLAKTLKNFLRTPVIVAILLGIIFNLTGLYSVISDGLIPQMILKAIGVIGNLTTPLVAIVIGFELYFKRESILPAVVTVLLRLIVWVPLAILFDYFIIQNLLHLDNTYRAAVLIMSILPAPFVVPIYLNDGDDNKRDFILSTLSIGTVVALLGVVLVGTLLG